MRGDAKPGSERTSWVTYRRPLAGVFEFGFCANGETKTKVKGAGRRPAVRTATAKRSMSRGSQESGHRAVVFGSTGIPACAASDYLRGVAKQENERTRSLILRVWRDRAALLRWHRHRFHDRLAGGACATERQNVGGVLIFSYDATLRNALRTTITRADDFCFAAADAGAAAGAFCCACWGAGGAAAESESAAAGDGRTGGGAMRSPAPMRSRRPILARMKCWSGRSSR